MASRVKKTKAQAPTVAARVASLMTTPDGFSCQGPAMAVEKRPEMGALRARAKASEEDHEGGEFGEEDLAGADREAGEREAIAQAGEERIPLHEGEERGDRHGESEEGEQVFADGRLVRGRGGDGGHLEQGVAFPVGVMPTMPMETSVAKTPMATFCQSPEVAPISLSKKRARKWRTSSKVSPWVSDEPFAEASSCGHDIEDAVGDRVGVLRVGELGEDAFEGGLRHQFAKVGHGIVGDDLSLAKDEHGDGDLLDDFENVRAVENHFAAGGEGVEEASGGSSRR